MNSIKGFGFVDGTKNDFNYEDLQDGVIYFVRTSKNKENGLIYFNGKKYGNPNIDAGVYPDNTEPVSNIKSTLKRSIKSGMKSAVKGPIEYVKFTAKVDNSSIGLLYISAGQTLEYSVNDGETWNSLTAGMSVSLAKNGDSVYVRGILISDNYGGQYHSDFHNDDSDNYTQFEMSGDIKLSGNINTLWNYEDINAPLKAYCGFKLFNYCTALSDISEISLPSGELSEHCYEMMFQGCTSLVNVSSSLLPSLEMKASCYASMFYGCINLSNVPELPAMTLAKDCYNSMFYHCESLTTAPVLPATTLKTDNSGCYNNMFVGCSSMNNIKCLVAEKEASVYTLRWVKGVASNGVFIKSKSGEIWGVNESGIPNGWTVVDAE